MPPRCHFARTPIQSLGKSADTSRIISKMASFSGTVQEQPCTFLYIRHVQKVRLKSLAAICSPSRRISAIGVSPNTGVRTSNNAPASVTIFCVSRDNLKNRSPRLSFSNPMMPPIFSGTAFKSIAALLRYGASFFAHALPEPLWAIDTFAPCRSHRYAAIANVSRGRVTGSPPENRTISPLSTAPSASAKRDESATSTAAITLPSESMNWQSRLQ